MTEYKLPFTAQEIEEKLANAGGGIIDVTELPTENINESAIYRVTAGESMEIYIVGMADVPMTLAEVMLSKGVSDCPINIQVVETLPETITPSVFENGGTVNLYVVESTGIAYGNIGGFDMSLGYGLFETEGFDKGWSTDIDSETETGAYCVYTTHTYSYHACKDGVWTKLSSTIKQTFTSLEDVARYALANPTFGLLSVELNATCTLNLSNHYYNVYDFSTVSVQKNAIEEVVAGVLLTFTTIRVNSTSSRIYVIEVYTDISGITQVQAYINHLDGQGSQSVEFKGFTGRGETITCWFSTI